MFIHDALEELVTSGETDISATNLRVKVNKLNKIIPGKAISGFDDQFRVSYIPLLTLPPEGGGSSTRRVCVCVCLCVCQWFRVNYTLIVMVHPLVNLAPQRAEVLVLIVCVCVSVCLSVSGSG